MREHRCKRNDHGLGNLSVRTDRGALSRIRGMSLDEDNDRFPHRPKRAGQQRYQQPDRFPLWPPLSHTVTCRSSCMGLHKGRQACSAVRRSLLCNPTYSSGSPTYSSVRQSCHSCASSQQQDKCSIVEREDIVLIFRLSIHVQITPQRNALTSADSATDSSAAQFERCIALTPISDYQIGLLQPASLAQGLPTWKARMPIVCGPQQQHPIPVGSESDQPFVASPSPKDRA
jgi:hypothetical protein